MGEMWQKNEVRDELDFSYTLKRGGWLSGLRIAVRRDNEVVVTAPRGMGVAAVEREFGQTLEKHEAEVRRQGENRAAYTSVKKAQELLGWEAKKNIADSIASLRLWYEKYPNGYSK